MEFLVASCLFFLLWPVIFIIVVEIPEMLYMTKLEELNEWSEGLHIHGKDIRLMFGVSIMNEVYPFYVSYNGYRTYFRKPIVTIYRIWRLKRLERSGRFVDMLKYIEKHWAKK